MTSPAETHDRSAWAIFLIFLRLGLTCFGGPIAHLGYFRDEFVERRRWLSEHSYADLVALCQFLPGPASSQVGMALGLSRAGYAGALAAWLGFTLPSALAMIVLAQGIASLHGSPFLPGVLHGLKIVAVAVVAQAVWGMARKLCTDGLRLGIMAAASCIVLLLPSATGQIGIIALAGILGAYLIRPEHAPPHEPLPFRIGNRAALLWLALFLFLLVALPLASRMLANPVLMQLDSFYRAGALVFGGGHVVLPLLQTEVVSANWVSNETFLAGYGAAQAVPGPLFTFAAFLGSAMNGTVSGWSGGFLCLVAIFAPSFLLVMGALPLWERLRGNRRMQAALAGINSAVVGILLAALYLPVWTSAILKPHDFGLALLAFVALMFWKWSPWQVVIASGVMGWLLSVVF